MATEQKTNRKVSTNSPGVIKAPSKAGENASISRTLHTQLRRNEVGNSYAPAGKTLGLHNENSYSRQTCILYMYVL